MEAQAWDFPTVDAVWNIYSLYDKSINKSVSAVRSFSHSGCGLYLSYTY